MKNVIWKGSEAQQYAFGQKGNSDNAAEEMADHILGKHQQRELLIAGDS